MPEALGFVVLLLTVVLDLKLLAVGLKRGVNQEWEDATAAREAVIANIPAETYSFQVSAHQAGKSEIAKQASSLITEPPVFYETIWFYLLMAGLGCLTLFRAAKYRTRVLKAR